MQIEDNQDERIRIDKTECEKKINNYKIIKKCINYFVS